METLEEKVKRLEEENESLNDIVKTQVKAIKECDEEKKELLEALEEIKQCTSNFDTYIQIEELIKKHTKKHKK